MVSHPMCFSILASYCFHWFLISSYNVPFVVWKNNIGFLSNLISCSFHAFCPWLLYLHAISNPMYFQNFSKSCRLIVRPVFSLLSPIIFGSFGCDHFTLCCEFNWIEQTLALKFHFSKTEKKMNVLTIHVDRGINIFLFPRPWFDVAMPSLFKEAPEWPF